MEALEPTRERCPAPIDEFEFERDLATIVETGQFGRSRQSGERKIETVKGAAPE